MVRGLSSRHLYFIPKTRSPYLIGCPDWRFQTFQPIPYALSGNKLLRRLFSVWQFCNTRAGNVMSPA